MARIDTLTNFLNDVASAIKTQLDDSTSIPASQFDTKILAIHTGGIYQSKSATLSTNGTYTISPDQDYDALSSVTITVLVEPTLQDINTTIVTNASTRIQAEAGYDGISSVTVVTNVPMQNTSDYTTCLNLARLIVGDVQIINDPYITYNVTVDVTNADQISINNRNLVITTGGE